MLQHTTIPLRRLGCAGSARMRVEQELEKAPGVARVYVNPVTEMAYVEYDPEQTGPEECVAAAERAGYLEQPHREGAPTAASIRGATATEPERRRRVPAMVLPCLLLAAGVLAVLWLQGAAASAWPMLMLAACVLMHLFGHGGHGGHSDHGGEQRPER